MAHPVNDVEVTRQLLRSLAPSDAVRVLDSLSPSDLGAVVTLVGDAQLADLLENMAAIDAAALAVWSAAVAAILPLLLRRFGVDPAVVSAPLITTVVDGTGLIIYFSVANRFLGL